MDVDFTNQNNWVYDEVNAIIQSYLTLISLVVSPHVGALVTVLVSLAFRSASQTGADTSQELSVKKKLLIHTTT